MAGKASFYHGAIDIERFTWKHCCIFWIPPRVGRSLNMYQHQNLLLRLQWQILREKYCIFVFLDSKAVNVSLFPSVSFFPLYFTFTFWLVGRYFLIPSPLTFFWKVGILRGLFTNVTHRAKNTEKHSEQSCLCFCEWKTLAKFWCINIMFCLFNFIWRL